ncbi:MAG: LL-diaminopimelate aminotransferase [Clostridiales bacterium]|nr:LL-diaminopimelate aminotransferase [Clostridiales bacterium]
MAFVNENYLKLQGNYLFAEISRRVSEFKKNNPNCNIISLGIGDVTKPLVSTVIKNLHKACDEMANSSTFKGYSPDRGYSFLIDAIAKNDYQKRGIDISCDEIFVSDGAKSDTGNFQELFSTKSTIAVTDPVYPVYVDSNVMAGRTGICDESGRFSRITYLPCTAQNNFIPSLPTKPVDLIYLCLPNNPTGTTLTHDQLKVWVDYAIENNSIILFDAAYEAFITEDNIPHSIYEIEGAKKCAIEFKSFSKTAGFTGVRCAYTVVPRDVFALTSLNEKISLNSLWARRQATKFNGVSYISQMAALATYTEEGQKEIHNVISYYLNNAKLIRNALIEKGFAVYGGVNSPYIWLATPNNMDSWDFFDLLLKKINVVGTPGVGFGPSGTGYFRLTSFASLENTIEAIKRFDSLSI